MSREVFISRVAAFLPNAPVSNDAMEECLGLINGKPSRARSIVLRSNGIRTRHYVIDPETKRPLYNNAQLTAEAIRALLGDGFEADDIECLCCGTSSPDVLMPNHAAMVHGELGNRSCEVIATSGICMSGVAAVKYGYLSVLSGATANAVATGSEVASTFMQAKNFDRESQAKVAELERNPEIAFEKEFLRWMLSDGAGAVLMQNAPNAHGLSLRIEWIDMMSFAHEMETCMYAGGEKRPDGTMMGWREFADLRQVMERSVFSVKQDVKLLNSNITRYAIEKGLSAVAAKRNLKADDIDYFLPHISSEFFREKVHAALERIGFAIPQERWYTNLAETGNVGSASWFTILRGIIDSGKLKRGNRLLCMVPESGRFSVAYLLLTVVEDAQG